MAKKRKGNQGSPATRALILLAVVGIPLIFVLAIMGTEVIVQTAPYLIIVVMAVAMAIYSGMTSALLYDYFEVQSPIWRWIPCIGELSLMDSKFVKFGVLFYALAAVFFGISNLPYSILRNFGEGVALDLPFYMMVLTFAMLGAVQIVKGIGLLGCMKTVSAEWDEKVGTSLGLIKSFAWLGFIPFVRVMAVYALNKPLSTLVTFNDMTVSDTDDVKLEEVEDDG